jgi:hypothetical protein
MEKCQWLMLLQLKTSDWTQRAAAGEMTIPHTVDQLPEKVHSFAFRKASFLSKVIKQIWTCAIIPEKQLMTQTYRGNRKHASALYTK